MSSRKDAWRRSIHFNGPVLLFPAVEGRVADVQLAGHGLRRHSAVDPARDRYDLLRGLYLSIWLLGSFVGTQTLFRNGSVLLRQVNGRTRRQRNHDQGSTKRTRITIYKERTILHRSSLPQVGNS